MADTLQKNKTGYDMIYLAACALHGRLPETERLHTMNLADVYQMAKFHAMQAVTFMALDSWRNAGSDITEILSPEVWKKWGEARSRALRKNILFDAEREKLFSFLNEKKIWHMPLKGVILQTYYPVYGMRQMVDNDILFDPQGRETVQKYFLENGYEIGQADDDSHDVYLKPPVYNFEMHFSLYRGSTNQTRYQYYNTVTDRLISCGKDRPSEYRFSDEDFYIYCTAHAYKHFTGPGIGIRAVMDSYVFLSEREDSLNWPYIEEECRKLEMQEYEYAVRHLCKKLFGQNSNFAAVPDSLTEEEQALTAFFISSGSHGTAENVLIQKIRSGIQRKDGITASGKLHYFLHRLFPDTEYLQKHYPFFGKHKILRPFLFIYRAIRALIRYPKTLYMELKLLWNAKK